jgi:hypothetical protein
MFKPRIARPIALYASVLATVLTLGATSPAAADEATCTASATIERDRPDSTEVGGTQVASS